MNYLEDWGRIIDKTAERRRNNEQEELKVLLGYVADFKPRELTHEQLLECLQQASHKSGDHRPAFAREWEDVRVMLVNEALRRLEGRP